MNIHQATGEFIRAIIHILQTKQNQAAHLSNIWGGWEKWLQGEIMLALASVDFNLSQEDNVYPNPHKSSDFVYYVSEDGANVQDICVVELKAVTAVESQAHFNGRILVDVDKLKGNLVVLNGNNRQIYRMSVAVTTVGKDFTDAQTTAISTSAEAAGGQDFMQTSQVIGLFKVYIFIWQKLNP